MEFHIFVSVVFYILSYFEVTLKSACKRRLEFVVFIHACHTVRNFKFFNW